MIQINQRLDVIGEGLHFGDSADEKVLLCLGHQQAGGFSHAELLRFHPQRFLTEHARGGRRLDLLSGTVHFNIGGANIQLHQLRKVRKGIFSLLPGQHGPLMTGFRGTIVKGIFKPNPHKGVIIVPGQIADRLPKRIRIPAFAETDEKIQQREQAVFGFDHLQVVLHQFQSGFI